MNSTEIIAAILLILRLAASAYLWQTLKIQKGLLQRPIKADPTQYDEQDIQDVWNFRRRLHYVTIALFVGNFIPIVLDSLVALKGIGIGEHIRTAPVLIIYAVSNALTMLLAAYLIFSVWRLANQTREVTDLELKHLKKSKNKGVTVE